MPYGIILFRFTAPLEIVTHFGSQFMNQLLTHFNAESGIKHHTTIPYSKEETFCLTNGISKTGPDYFTLYDEASVEYLCTGQH